MNIVRVPNIVSETNSMLPTGCIRIMAVDIVTAGRDLRHRGVAITQDLPERFLGYGIRRESEGQSNDDHGVFQPVFVGWRLAVRAHDAFAENRFHSSKEKRDLF